MEKKERLSNDLIIYKKNNQPPQWALKEILAGRLKGKTDINPQWRYEALTETFGLIGFGWKYVVTKMWLEEGSAEQKCAFVNIDLYIKIDNEWSEPIPGNGGSMLINKETNGLYTSDEAYKMATTDALSVACKMLGIGATIYGGTKYPTEKKEEPKREQITDSIPTPLMTKEQKDELSSLAEKLPESLSEKKKMVLDWIKKTDIKSILAKDMIDKLKREIEAHANATKKS